MLIQLPLLPDAQWGPLLVNPAFVTHVVAVERYVRPNVRDTVTEVHVVAACSSIMQNCASYRVAGTPEEIRDILDRKPPVQPATKR